MWHGMLRNVRLVEKSRMSTRILMESLGIPVWKWVHINMYFITTLQKTHRDMDTTWVIMDRLTKSVNFMGIHESYSLNKLSNIYFREMISRRGVPVSMVSNMDVNFTSKFWKRFHENLGT